MREPSLRVKRKRRDRFQRAGQLIGLVSRVSTCHKLPMSTEPMYPFSLEVFPCEKPAGHFQWSIRERGRLIQRSDRPHPTESKAREKGEAELERLFFGSRDRR